MYARAVRKTSGFAKLKELLGGEKDLYLRDFDAYQHKKLGMSYTDVVNLESRKMGHAFVLAMMLEKVLSDDGTVLS